MVVTSKYELKIVKILLLETQNGSTVLFGC